jgi:hypothetical protein
MGWQLTDQEVSTTSGSTVGQKGAKMQNVAGYSVTS